MTYELDDRYSQRKKRLKHINQSSLKEQGPGSLAFLFLGKGGHTTTMSVRLLRSECDEKGQTRQVTVQRPDGQIETVAVHANQGELTFAEGVPASLTRYLREPELQVTPDRFRALLERERDLFARLQSRPMAELEHRFESLQSMP